MGFGLRTVPLLTTWNHCCVWDGMLGLSLFLSTATQLNSSLGVTLLINVFVILLGVVISNYTAFIFASDNTELKCQA